MNILHVCSITNNKTSGISNVVPEHFINQSKFVKVALLNCNNTQIERLKSEKNVFYYNEINKNIDKNEQLKEKDRKNALEEEMNMYGLDDDEKELVRKGEYDPWDFDPDNPTDEDDYYKDDLDYDDDDDEY